ncbi:MAG: histidine phosphatase family protein [Gammaproteobacteria bacterium]|nr:MAG: histidine phosphatase family protein [Gammaproteobacteria bacterium]
MTRIILVRHGHVEGISPERFRGRRDVDLSELGARQARGTAQRIAQQWRPLIVYTSPLRRCLQTAEAIAAACGISAAIRDDLTDLHYGDWEWRTHEEVRAQCLDQPLSAYWRLAQDPCALSEIEISDHGTTVHRVNETHHLFET